MDINQQLYVWINKVLPEIKFKDNDNALNGIGYGENEGFDAENEETEFSGRISIYGESRKETIDASLRMAHVHNISWLWMLEGKLGIDPPFLMSSNDALVGPARTTVEIVPDPDFDQVLPYFEHDEILFHTENSIGTVKKAATGYELYYFYHPEHFSPDELRRIKSAEWPIEAETIPRGA